MKNYWSPYVAGGLTGFVLVASILFFNGYFGASTTFSRVGSLFVELVGFDLSSIAFFSDYDGFFSYHTINDFQTTFVLGIMIGAFISAKMSGTFKLTKVPELFKERYGNDVKRRYIYAFVGGFIMIIGARVANGCASWWGLSVSSKLDLAGFSTLAFFFIGGVIVNQLFIYRQIKG